MKRQKALDIKWNKIAGDMVLDELNMFLDQGWVISLDPVQGGGGDILVIIEQEQLDAQSN